MPVLPTVRLATYEELGYRVLLVDDSEITLAVTADILETDGHEVRTAMSLDELDVRVAGWTPDIIVMDVNMPNIGGVEMCGLLRQRPELGDVVLVIASALAPVELAELARTCGADGWVSKANGFEDLTDELRAVVAAHLHGAPRALEYSASA